MSKIKIMSNSEEFLIMLDGSTNVAYAREYIYQGNTSKNENRKDGLCELYVLKNRIISLELTTRVYSTCKTVSEGESNIFLQQSDVSERDERSYEMDALTDIKSIKGGKLISANFIYLTLIKFNHY